MQCGRKSASTFGSLRFCLDHYLDCLLAFKAREWAFRCAQPVTYEVAGDVWALREQVSVACDIAYGA
jgi:hypothetical protein